MSDTPANNIIEDFTYDEKALALALAVTFWGLVSQNPKTTPAGEGQVLKTADRYYHWLSS